MLPDKYNLTHLEAMQLFEGKRVSLIHQLSKIELVTTTYEQTKAIVEGERLNDVTEDEVLVIKNLSNACNYLLNETSVFSLEIAEKINSFVAYYEALEWGKIRNGEVSIGGISYKPPIPVRTKIVHDIEQIMTMNVSETYKAIKYMYYAMRKQLFWDGNKRTAILSANYILLRAGKGMLTIDEQLLENWHELLREYYESNDDRLIIEWTYNNLINIFDNVSSYIVKR